MTTSNDYSPGACNIGPAEINRRKRAGAGGLAIFVLGAAILLATSASPWLHFLLFLPAFMAAIGFIQAASRFCVYFGIGSMVNFGEVGQQAQIVDRTSRRLDRARAFRLLGLSALAAALPTLAAYAVALSLG